MSDKKDLFIPHPLCIDDVKVMNEQWEKQGVESLVNYLKDSANPRWAASFLVRAVAKGLVNADPKASISLQEVANQLVTSQK